MRNIICILLLLAAVAANSQTFLSGQSAAVGQFAFSSTPSGGGGGLSIINSWTNAMTANATNLTVPISGVTAGNLLVIGVVVYGGAAGDSTNTLLRWDGLAGGTTNFNRISNQENLGIDGSYSSFWYASNCPAGVSSVFVAGTTNSQRTTCVVQEISGASASAPWTSGEVASGKNSGGFTSFSPGNVTNGTPNSILMSWWCSQDAGHGTTSITNNGTGTVGNYTTYNSTSYVLAGSSKLAVGIMSYQVVSATATQNHTWTNMLPASVASQAYLVPFH